MILFQNPSLRLAFALTALIWPLSGCQAPLHKSESLLDAAFPTDSRNQAIHLDEKQKTEIQIGLARSLEARGDLDRAETIYREILAAQPKSVSTLHRLAIVCDQQHRFEESQPLFLKAIDLASENAVIWGDYGYSLYRQRKWHEAEKTLRQALELNPRDKRTHNHLGLVLAQTGQSDAARAEFLLAGCSETEAQSNLRTILKLNEEQHGADGLSQRTLDSRQSPKVPLPEPSPHRLPDAEPQSTWPQDQAPATVHISSSEGR
jgi:Flp pilus assembly protein TadD